MNIHCTCDKPKLITNRSYTHAINVLGTMEAFSSCISLMMESKHGRSSSLSSANRVWKVFPAGPTPGIATYNLVLESSEMPGCWVWAGVLSPGCWGVLQRQGCPGECDTQLLRALAPGDCSTKTHEASDEERKELTGHVRWVKLLPPSYSSS